MVSITNVSHYSNQKILNQIEFFYSLEIICSACFTDYYLVSNFDLHLSFDWVYKHYKLEADLLNFPKLDFLMDLGKSNNDLTQAHQLVTYHCCLKNHKER